MENWLTSIPVELYAVISWFVVFFVTYSTIPRIITLVRVKGLMDDPDHRSSHSEKTPTFGGVSFFLSLVVASLFLEYYDVDSIGMIIVVGLTILFFVGLKDDLVEIRPRTKILAQLLVAIFLLTNEGLQLNSLGGFFWINELPPWLILAFGCFIILSIVNSYNLIDGINGSASMVGIAVFSFFSYIFYQASAYYYFLLAFVSIAFLLAFLRYNLSKRHRIFMGDTGSMIVGFVIGVLTLKYMALDASTLNFVQITPINKLALIVAILFIPFTDTIRVFLIRTVRHGRPFSPDRSHVHHVMIDYMHLSHTKASILLATINVFVFIVVYLCNVYFCTEVVYAILALLMITFVGVLFYFNRSYYVRKQKNKIRKEIKNILDAPKDTKEK